MSKQNRVLLFIEHYENIKDLTLEQKGKILDNIFNKTQLYENDASVVMASKYILSQIKRADDAYELKCKTNAEIGRLGGLAKASERYRTLETVSECSLPNPNPNPKKEIQDKKDTPSHSSARFIIPSVEEIRNYIKDMGWAVDADAFHSHYDAVGWIRGKTPIRNWKACIKTWQYRNNPKPKASIMGDL